MNKITFKNEEQKQIRGIFSGLNFSGKVIGMIGECLRVEVINPHNNLPVGNTLDGLKNILTFHPNDKNVSYEIGLSPISPFPSGNVDDPKSEAFAASYRIARAEGDRRFGSECKHERVKGGICLSCYRKVM